MKKAVELSVNFLVIFVLSMVIFGFGITLVYNMFFSAMDLSKVTDDNLRAQIDDLVCSANTMMCLSGNRQTFQKKTLAPFGVFIRNVDSFPREYNITILPRNAYEQNYDEIRKDIDGNFPNIRILQLENTTTVASGQQGKYAFAIYIDRRATAGTYEFDIMANSTTYGEPRFHIDRLTLQVR
ncbi:MAG: hypothetical protein ACMXYC_01355 [Candidatus Woesearchaeota archaeon]